MRNTCMIILVFILFSVHYSQTKNDVYEFLMVDEIPKFEGNGMDLSEYLIANLIHPKFFSGDDEVVTSFVIDENGNVCNIKVIKYYTEISKNAVIKALSSMPHWKPGRYKGKHVRVRLYITVNFKMI